MVVKDGRFYLSHNSLNEVWRKDKSCLFNQMFSFNGLANKNRYTKNDCSKVYQIYTLMNFFVSFNFILRSLNVRILSKSPIIKIITPNICGVKLFLRNLFFSIYMQNDCSKVYQIYTLISFDIIMQRYIMQRICFFNTYRHIQ